MPEPSIMEVAVVGAETWWRRAVMEDQTPPPTWLLLGAEHDKVMITAWRDDLEKALMLDLVVQEVSTNPDCHTVLFLCDAHVRMFATGEDLPVPAQLREDPQAQDAVLAVVMRGMDQASLIWRYGRDDRGRLHREPAPLLPPDATLRTALTDGVRRALAAKR